MKKNLLNWMTILMVAIVSVAFVSCGDDDDDESTFQEQTPVTSPIVGTWDYSEKNGSYYLIEQWVFKADGSFVYNIEEGGIFMAGQGLLPPTKNVITGTWLFRDTTNELIIITSDNNTYAWKAYIQGNTMTIVNHNNDLNGPYIRAYAQ